MHTTISDCNELESGLSSRCVFSNINRMCHLSILKFISAINNLANDDAEKTELLIMYSINSHPICLNDREDEHYFIKTFLMLFRFKDDGYLAKRKMAILL